MATSRAPPRDRGRSDASLARCRDNARDDDQLTHQVALQVPQHLWVLVTPDLDLELGNVVNSSNITLADDCAVVVLPVDLLHCVLKVGQELGGLLAKLLRKSIVEVLQVVQRDAQHVDAFLCISLQLLSKGSMASFRLTCR